MYFSCCYVTSTSSMLALQLLLQHINAVNVCTRVASLATNVSNCLNYFTR